MERQREKKIILFHLFIFFPCFSFPIFSSHILFSLFQLVVVIAVVFVDGMLLLLLVLLIILLVYRAIHTRFLQHHQKIK